MLDYLRKSKIFLDKAKKKIKKAEEGSFFNLKTLALFLLVFFIFSIIASPAIKKSDFYFANISKAFETAEEGSLFVIQRKSFLPESPEFLLMDNSFVKASSPPTVFSPQILGGLISGYEPEEEIRATVIEHIVKSGDTLSSLAAQHGISLNTLLWANDLNSSSKLKIGQKLIILPVSGTIHHVKSGDTISGIAKTYKGKTSEIIAFNSLSGEADIYIGDIVIIPGGVMPVSSAKQQSAPPSLPLASSYFIIPVSSPYIITQGLHWYNAIDFSHKGLACGKPVFAVAEGTVQRTGYDRTAGNYVRILHSNGVITFYGHLSSILVSSGQAVSQGTRIGLIGNTGYTIGQTGCHLHFEVRGAKNPFAR